MGAGLEWLMAANGCMRRSSVGAGKKIKFTDLAQELGYFDQAHFTRDFRKLVGKSPAAYRRWHGSF